MKNCRFFYQKLIVFNSAHKRPTQHGSLASTGDNDKECQMSLQTDMSGTDKSRQNPTGRICNPTPVEDEDDENDEINTGPNTEFGKTIPAIFEKKVSPI